MCQCAIHAPNTQATRIWISDPVSGLQRIARTVSDTTIQRFARRIQNTALA
jgi:hypothetical protein